MNIDDLLRQNIKKLKPYQSARHEFSGKAEVYLDANENPYPTDFNRYPDPAHQALKLALAEIKKCQTEYIFFGNGSDEIIDLMFRAFVEPGIDEAIILPPTYGMYKVYGDINHAIIREVPLLPNFEIDEGKLIGSFHQKSKLLFICSPNNPTAHSFPRQQIESIIQAFPGIVIIDEAYIDFSEQSSCLSLIEKYKNIVVMQTFSKAWGLAGLRLGMAYAVPEIINVLYQIKPPYNINSFTQKYALQQLQEVNIAEIIENIKANRAQLIQDLNATSIIDKIYPSDTNFLLCKIKIDARQLYTYLLAAGIVVRDRSTTLHCSNCLRFTVGTQEENNLLIQKLNNYA